jgi:hypothetical protein
MTVEVALMWGHVGAWIGADPLGRERAAVGELHRNSVDLIAEVAVGNDEPASRVAQDHRLPACRR